MRRQGENITKGKTQKMQDYQNSKKHPNTQYRHKDSTSYKKILVSRARPYHTVHGERYDMAEPYGHMAGNTSLHVLKMEGFLCSPKTFKLVFC